MNNLLVNAVGIDETIKGIQKDLYNELSKVWKGDVDGYGRVYKNPVNTGESIPDYYQTSKIVTPSWYNALEKDYQDVYYDDDKSAVFCFLTTENDTTLDSVVYNTDIKIAFMVDLEKIYPGDIERSDSKAQKDAIEILRNFSFNKYEINGIERRIDFVFREYLTSSIRFNDMHPLHCFAVKVNLQYFLTDKC